MKNETNMNQDTRTESGKKRRFGTVRAALMCLLVFTLLCGIVYTLSVTVVGQALYPYEANGSQIIVTLKDGTKRSTAPSSSAKITRMRNIFSAE